MIFIEGLTKDINPIIRQNSAIGLAGMGTHTLRTLLVGLHDENINVRRTVEKEIVEKFSVKNIIENFGTDKNSHRMSLKIAIRDILEKELPLNIATKNFFISVLRSLDKEADKNINNDNDKGTGTGTNN